MGHIYSTTFSHGHITLLCTQCLYTGIPVAGSILLLLWVCTRDNSNAVITTQATYSSTSISPLTLTVCTPASLPPPSVPVEWPGSARGRQTRTAPLASWLYVPVIWENENKIQCNIHTYIQTCTTIKVSKRKTSEWLSKDSREFTVWAQAFEMRQRTVTVIATLQHSRSIFECCDMLSCNTSQCVDELWTRLKNSTILYPVHTSWGWHGLLLIWALS